LSFAEFSLKERTRIIASLAIVGIGVGILTYYRCVPRVYVPLYAYITGMFLLFSDPNGSLPSQKTGFRTLKVVLIGCSLLVFSQALGQSYAAMKQQLGILHFSEMEKDYIGKCSRIVERQHSSTPLLVLMDPVQSGVLGADKVHPLKELSDYPALRIFPFGTLINSPRYYAALYEMNLKSGSEFLKWTVDREEVLFVTVARSRRQQQRLKYLWESYFSRHVVESQKAALLPVHDFRNKKGMGMVFYRMSSITAS